MARFGKLVDNVIEYAPSSMTDKQKLYQAGYQPVDDTPIPSDFSEYNYSYIWKENRKRWVKIWVRGSKKPDLRPASEKREVAYQTKYCVSWNEELLTIDQAVKVWYQYTAEGRDMTELSKLIEAEKNKIREEIPDV